MRRVAYALLFLLVGILMPILIWVALFIAIRKPLLQAMKQRVLQREATRTVGEILTSAGLSIQWAPESKQLALATFGRRPMPEIGELLARAGL